MKYQPVLGASEVSDYVHEVFSESDMYNWTVDEVGEGRVVITMKTGARDIRPGGTVSGPTMFALADIAAYILTLAHIGKYPLAVTTNLNINFLNKPAPGNLHAEARLIKLGKRLSVCDVSIFSGESETLVAHATATYSLPPR